MEKQNKTIYYTKNNEENKIHSEDGEYFTIQWHALCWN